MTYKEKCEKFANMSGRDIFRNKTPIDDLPLQMGLGSSSHHPEREGGMTTCDIVFWMKFSDDNWFRPYGSFYEDQIIKMIEICRNDQQVISLMELLSATKS